MRVLVLTNMFPSASKPAYGVFVRDQVEDLRALGVDVEVLAIAGDETRLNYARAVSELRRALARRPADLVHAHYGLAGAVALTQGRVPVVTTFHGSDTYIWWHRAVSWVVARRSNYAADHISIRSLASDPSGSVFAVVKTSLNSSGQPAIVVLEDLAPSVVGWNW